MINGEVFKCKPCIDETKSGHPKHPQELCVSYLCDCRCDRAVVFAIPDERRTKARVGLGAYSESGS